MCVWVGVFSTYLCDTGTLLQSASLCRYVLYVCLCVCVCLLIYYGYIIVKMFKVIHICFHLQLSLAYISDVYVADTEYQ